MPFIEVSFDRCKQPMTASLCKQAPAAECPLLSAVCWTPSYPQSQWAMCRHAFCPRCPQVVALSLAPPGDAEEKLRIPGCPPPLQQGFPIEPICASTAKKKMQRTMPFSEPCQRNFRFGNSGGGGHRLILIPLWKWSQLKRRSGCPPWILTLSIEMMSNLPLCCWILWKRLKSQHAVLENRWKVAVKKTQ